jgi:hypothetical protein
MQQDPNYRAVLASYNHTTGFGSARTAAITIVSNFLLANQVSGDVQSIKDAQLYTILTANSMGVAVPAITSVISVTPLAPNAPKGTPTPTVGPKGPPAPKPTSTPTKAINMQGATTMQQDPTYPIVLQAYNSSTGFGNHRNTAIVIVGNFMRLHGLTGNPQNANNAQMFNILMSPDVATAKASIAAAIPATTMRQDANYQNIMLSHNSRAGFGANRSTAIAIVGKFMNTNNLGGSPTRFTDGQLYNILSATSIPLAISAINGQ